MKIVLKNLKYKGSKNLARQFSSDLKKRIASVKLAKFYDRSTSKLSPSFCFSTLHDITVQR